MSFGQTEKPCENFRHWFKNGTTCGRCGWDRDNHQNFPVIQRVVFALVFDDLIIGYMKWSPETCNWMYADTYNEQSDWRYDPPKLAYSKIELAELFPDSVR